MNFNTWFSQLQTRTAKNSGAGLVAFNRLLLRLGNPQHAYKIIHVAGTNGKGSVCTWLAQALVCAGYQTGLFISPHLVSPTERMQINGIHIAEDDFKRLAAKVQACEQEPLNFFELITATAFLYFAEEKAAYVVLETGLGGRKDPTNVCLPILSIITSVGLDHTQLLGNTLEKIAVEKAGIIKRGVPVLCGYLSAPAARVVQETAREQKAPFNMIETKKPLGNAQLQNKHLVRQAAKLLGITDKDVDQAIETAYLPGRFERMQWGEKTIILDGAHNPPAVENLMAYWKQTPFVKQRAAVLCGFMQDKDYTQMLAMLANCFQTGVITAVSSPRAAGEQQVHSLLPLGWEFVPDVKTALAAVRSQADVILCTGSFYLLGEVKAALGALERVHSL